MIALITAALILVSVIPVHALLTKLTNQKINWPASTIAGLMLAIAGFVIIWFQLHSWQKYLAIGIAVAVATALGNKISQSTASKA